LKSTLHIRAFVKLGHKLQESLYSTDNNLPLNKAIRKSHELNPWFTPTFYRLAIRNFLPWLEASKLSKWVEKYQSPEKSMKTGIIMAGNIPLVGFHDFLCTLISGHTAMIKLSGKDAYLLPAIAKELIDIEPAYRDKIHFLDKVPNNIEALIATGSDNTARYFDYYFKGTPRIIRKNRTSLAVLNGDETPEELEYLADDICTFFGLGCRNVSKLYLPAQTSLAPIIEALAKYKWLSSHEQYANNLRYQKARLKALNIPFIDAGPVLFVEDAQLNSQVGILHLEFFNSIENVKQILEINTEKIQCIVGNELNKSLNLGSVQKPDIGDYADNVDTLKFLTELRS